MTSRDRPGRSNSPPHTAPSFADAIVHESHEALFILDPEQDFRVLFVNDAACRHFGRDRQELEKMSPADWDPTASVEGLHQMWRTWTGSGVPFVFETRHRRADGTLVPVEVFGGVLHYEGRDLAIGSIRDISARKQIEEALKASEDRYRDLVEHSAALMCTHDLEGRLLSVNRRAAELLGYSVGELLTKGIADLLAPEWRPQFEAYLERLCSRGVDAGLMQVVTARGERRLWEYHNTLRKEGLVRPIVRGMAHDVTDRQMALEALHESEARLRLAMQAANQGTYDLDVQSGEAKVSPEYATMLGYDPAQFHETNAAWIARLHPDDREPVAAVYRDYIAGRIPEYRVEFRQRTRTGEWKWILSLGRVVDRDRTGQPRRMLGTHTDITERKHAELERDREASRRRILFEQATDGIVVVDERCGVVEANASFARMLGYATEEVLGLHTWDWDTRYPTRDAALAAVVEWMRAPGTLEVTLRRKDGSPLEAEISFTPTTWGDARLLLIVCRDITERRRLEDERAKLQAQLVQAQKMESVGRLAGGVAHDFNNMLSVILGYTELALASVNPADRLFQQLQEIRQAANRSSDLTRQLLAFSRQQTVTPQMLDLNDAVSGALRMMRRLIGEDIQLEWSPGPRLWTVNIDPTQVDQILLNLAVNSRDAIRGVGRIGIRTENITVTNASGDPVGLGPGEYVRLTVEDDGIGMEPHVLEHLFEPFYTTKEVGRGTGLGLAMVYGIVQQNDGFIDVSSAPGRGATFHLYLRRAIPAPGGVLDAGERPSTTPRVADGQTVLLVEDEPSILRLGTVMLERLGHTVLAAETPADAIRIAQTHPGGIDLLMTDVVMPSMDGRQLARRLAEIRPGLPCLFMSGYTADVIANRGILFDGVQHLQKPFTSRDLAAKLRDVFAARLADRP